MYHLRGYEFSMRLKRLNFISSLCTASTASSSFFIFMPFSLKFRSLSSFLGVTIKYITIFVPIDTDLFNAHALFSPSHCLTVSHLCGTHSRTFSTRLLSAKKKRIFVRDVFILVKSVSHPFFEVCTQTQDISEKIHIANIVLVFFALFEKRLKKRRKKHTPYFHS